jgi:hypothetical protein
MITAPRILDVPDHPEPSPAWRAVRAMLGLMLGCATFLVILSIGSLLLDQPGASIVVGFLIAAIVTGLAARARGARGWIWSVIASVMLDGVVLGLLGIFLATNLGGAAVGRFG